MAYGIDDVAEKPAKRSPGRPRYDAPSPIERHIADRIRLRRKLLGLTQQQLGERLGVTFQQVQKYENAANRITVGRLWDLAGALDVPVGFFFDGMDDPQGRATGFSAEGAPYESPDPDIGLVSRLGKIETPGLRKALVSLIDQVSEVEAHRRN